MLWFPVLYLIAVFVIAAALLCRERPAPHGVSWFVVFPHLRPSKKARGRKAKEFARATGVAAPPREAG